VVVSLAKIDHRSVTMTPLCEDSREMVTPCFGPCAAQVVAVGGLDEAEYRWVIEFQSSSSSSFSSSSSSSSQILNRAG
jgi:hypothetical protein